MVAIGRPRGLTAAASTYDGAFLLAAAPAILLHLLVLTRGGPPTGPEPVPAAAIDVPFARQLAFLQALPADGPLSTSRGVCLLAGLLAALGLWTVARKLGAGREGAATAVVVAGSTPLALLLHAEVEAGAFAALWLVGAAIVVSGVVGTAAAGRVAVAATGVCAAVLTAPVAAVGLLAGIAHLAARGPRDRATPRIVLLEVPTNPVTVRGRYAVAVVAGGMAAGTAGIAVASPGPGAAGTTTGVLPVVGIVLGTIVVAVAWWRVPRLRPLATAAAALLGCALWPGPVRLTALLIALPPLAVLAGALVGALTVRRAVPVAGMVAVTAALTLGLSTVALPIVTLPIVGPSIAGPSTVAGPAPEPSHYRTIAAALVAELDPSTPVHSDAVVRAGLVAAGVPAARFGDPAPDAVRVAGACVPGETTIATLPAPGGVAAMCHKALGQGTDPGMGVVLAGNPALTLADPARRALFDGRVDARLVMMVAGATGSYRISVEDFPAMPGAAPDAPLRTAVLGASDPGLAGYLAAQLPPYRPDVSRRPGGGLVLHVRVGS